MWTKYTYLLVHTGTLLYPLLKSFESKINYSGKWRALFKALLPVAVFFICWDILFTVAGVWSFNESYIIGIHLGALPVEECMFFFIAPFSSLFIYEVMNYYVSRDILGKYAKYIAIVLAVLFLFTAIIYSPRIYTLTVFSLLAMLMLLHALILKTPYLGRFFLSFTVCIFPFLIVNGILTALPVVRYNDAEIIGVRIYTIPIEDLFYGMLLLLMDVTLYEYYKKRHQIR